MPKFAFIKFSVKASLHSIPDVLHRSQISDHAPIGVTISARRTPIGHNMPISKHICNSKRFRDEEQVFVPGLPVHPIARWQQHKIILTHSAKVSRDELAAKHDREGLVTSQSLSTILNMVWNNDVELFNKIYAGSSTVRENVKLKSGTFIFIDSVKFDKLFASTKTVELEAKIAKLTNKPSSRKRRKKITVSS